MIETLGQKHGVTIKTDVARLPEAQFSLDAKGQGTLQVPKGSAFRDLNHQVSSVMQAVAHSTLAREAQRQVAAAPADQPHEAAAARVAGYQLSPSKQAKSPAFSVTVPVVTASRASPAPMACSALRPYVLAGGA